MSLSGISHITLSSACLAKLQSTPLDERFSRICNDSLTCLKNTSEPKLGKQNGDYDFLVEQDLQKALSNPTIDHLQTDALSWFGKAEEELRDLVRAMM